MDDEQLKNVGWTLLLPLIFGGLTIWAYLDPSTSRAAVYAGLVVTGISIFFTFWVIKDTVENPPNTHLEGWVNPYETTGNPYVIADRQTIETTAPTPATPDDFQKQYHLAKLQMLVEAYLYLFPGMPMPTINFAAKSYTEDEDVNGWARGGDQIFILEKFFYNDLNADFEHPVLHLFVKHELIHCWIFFNGEKDDAMHGTRFDYWTYHTMGGLPRFKNKDNPYGDPFGVENAQHRRFR